MVDWCDWDDLKHYRGNRGNNVSSPSKFGGAMQLARFPFPHNKQNPQNRGAVGLILGTIAKSCAALHRIFQGFAHG
jgi:hypothetical protein